MVLGAFCGRYHLVVFDLDEPREDAFGDFDPGEDLAAGGVVDDDGEVDGEVGDEGEGVGAVEGHGGEDGEDLGFKVAFEVLLCFGAEVSAFVDVDAFLCEGGFEVLAPAAAGFGLKREEGFEDLLHLFGWCHAVGRLFENAAADLAEEAGDPDHHELVDVVCEDGEEFDAFKERMVEVCGFFEDAAVELDEGDFSVNIEGFVREADRVLFGRCWCHLYCGLRGVLCIFLVSIGISSFYGDTMGELCL